MADMTAYITAKYNVMIAEITKDLSDMNDKVVNTQNLLRALKNPDMLVDGAPLTLDRIQVMENGDFRILPTKPPAPPITEVCVQEPEKGNGKKPSKELANALTQ